MGKYSPCKNCNYDVFSTHGVGIGRSVYLGKKNSLLVFVSKYIDVWKGKKSKLIHPVLIICKCLYAILVQPALVAIKQEAPSWEGWFWSHKFNLGHQYKPCHFRKGWKLGFVYFLSSQKVKLLIVTMLTFLPSKYRPSSAPGASLLRPFVEPLMSWRNWKVLSSTLFVWLNDNFDGKSAGIGGAGA